jgi:uncharacterized membrane protein YraQ (UPF0718 family)
MELKQKKTIYWSVVLTLLISIFLYKITTDDTTFNEGIWNGIILTMFLSSLFLYLPSLIIWRVIFGKINYEYSWDDIPWYIFILCLPSIIMLYTLINYNILEIIQNFLVEYVMVITFLFFLISSFFISHLVFKTFIFNFFKEDNNDKKYDRILNQIKEELKKEDEEFLNQLKDGLKNIDTKDWKF